VFSIYGGRKTFIEALAQLIFDNLGSRSRTVDTDDIARKIIVQTYSLYAGEESRGKAYHFLLDEFGPCMIAPIVFTLGTLATRMWKIEFCDVLMPIVYHQTPHYGFQVAKYICQCFNYGTWVDLRNSFVRGSKTNDGYIETEYSSPKSAARVADNTRYYAVWIAAVGLSYFLELTRACAGYIWPLGPYAPTRFDIQFDERDLLTREKARSYFISENADILRVARQELVSIPDKFSDLPKILGDGARASCIKDIDNWLQVATSLE